ncbi:MAG: hypothetical protein ACRC2U_06175 [Aeromonas sp.]
MVGSFLSELYIDIWSWEMWRFIAILTVGLWGMLKGRTACLLIVVAAFFMFLSRTNITWDFTFFKRSEFTYIAKTEGVCADVKENKSHGTETKAQNTNTSYWSSGDDNDVLRLESNYESCVDNWVSNNSDVKQIYFLTFIFNIIGELIQAMAFLTIIAMLREREVKCIKDVVSWYRMR